MRAVIQRVTEASVTTDDREISAIGRGMVVLLGIAKGDTGEEASFLADKISGLRIFQDQDGKMNLSISDISGDVLVVSQFTLASDTRKGRRPGFDTAAAPDKARGLYEHFIDKIREKGVRVESGEFGAEMMVHIHNDGPVTFVLDAGMSRQSSYK